MRAAKALIVGSMTLLLNACGDTAQLPEVASIGPNPPLPTPAKELIPTVNIAPAKGWPEGAKPAPASDLSVTAFATGLATCDSGPKETWQPQEKLEQLLKDKGWQVRRIKVDGGCYEVYALNEKGERVEAYFHPKTLEPVPTKKE